MRETGKAIQGAFSGLTGDTILDPEVWRGFFLSIFLPNVMFVALLILGIWLAASGSISLTVEKE
jgi:hypothetical protein